MNIIYDFKIFESVMSYKFNKNENGDYLFSDDIGNEFKVEFRKEDEDYVEVIYLVKFRDKWTYENVSTNIFKITETILGKILPLFLQENNWVDVVSIKGLSKETESDHISKRTKIYLRYLDRNPINGWSVERSGNEILIFKN